MSRTYTTPVSRSQPDLDGGRLVKFGLAEDMQYDEAGDVIRESINFELIVDQVDANGAIAGTVREVVNIDDWPAALKTDMKSLRDKVIAYAETQGYLQPGTDEDDMV
jgi:hypothetical protein